MGGPMQICWGKQLEAKPLPPWRFSHVNVDRSDLSPGLVWFLRVQTDFTFAGLMSGINACMMASASRYALPATMNNHQ